MKTVLRKRSFISLLLALVPFLVSCKGGADRPERGGDRPDWSGAWKVESSSYGSPESPIYWRLSTDELRLISTRKGTNHGCIVNAYEVKGREKNTVKALGTTPLVENKTLEIQLKNYEKSLTLKVLDSHQKEAVGNEQVLTEVEEVPLDVDTECTTDGGL